MIPNKTSIFIVLIILIGFLVHRPSLEMAIYGDEWIDIYWYETQISSYAQLGNLPGPLKYLTPYGFGIFLVGGLYQVFGTHYPYFFAVSMFFKIFASLCLLWLCLALPIKNLNSKSKFILGFLTATLFLVGYTGIQNTDWIHYMHIYLATGLFILTFLFQIKFYQNPSYKNIWLFLLFGTLSLMIGTVRVFPIIFTLPLFDLYQYLISKDKLLRKLVIRKGLLFIIIVFVLWAAGLFGGPFEIYTYGEWNISKFLETVSLNPQRAIEVLIFWFGTLFLPELILKSRSFSVITGSLVIYLIAKSLFKSIKEKNGLNLELLFGINFLVFVLITWYYLPTTMISSSHRYLLLLFTSGCIWAYVVIGKLASNQQKFYSYLVFIIILFHAYSVNQAYQSWLNIGRSSEYVNSVDLQLKKDFPNPLESVTIIYIDSSDASIKQSTVFGLALKIAVFSKTWDPKYIPHVVDDQKTLQEMIQKQITASNSKEIIIKNIYGYKIEGKEFISITDSLRNDLKFKI